MSTLVSHENDKAVFTVEVSFEDFKKEIQGAYLKNRGRFNIPGFRKGKAPKHIIELNYGKEVFWADALDALLPEAYVKGIEDLDLRPIARPEVDVNELEEEKPILFTFTVETQPVPELVDYSVIEVEKLQEKVSEADVDSFIKREIEKNKVVKEVEDRPVKEGDIVTIDFEGFKEGVAFEGGKAENYDLKIGSKTFIPGFEEKLIGANKADKLDLELTFPEDYQAEDLKGKDVVFKVEVKAVKEEILPELDNDFVMDVSEFDTVEDYKLDVEKKLQEQLETSNKARLNDLVMAKVIEMTPVSVPEVMLESQLEREFSEYEHNLTHMGLTMDMFYSATQSTKEDVLAQLRPRAEEKVKAELILNALAEKNEVEASEEEIEAEYKEIAGQYGQDDEKMLERLKKSVDVSYVKDVIKNRKVIEDLVKNVVFVEKKVEEAEKTEE